MCFIVNESILSKLDELNDNIVKFNVELEKISLEQDRLLAILEERLSSN